MKEITFTELIVETKTAISSFKLKESTLKNSYNTGFNEIIQYYENENNEIFSLDLTEQFITSVQQRYDLKMISYSKYRIIRKVVTLLKEVYETEKLECKYLPKCTIDNKINPYFLSFLTLYVNDKRREGLYSEGTINVYK